MIIFPPRKVLLSVILLWVPTIGVSHANDTWIADGGLLGAGESPHKAFRASGDVTYRDLGDPLVEASGRGFRLDSSKDENGDGKVSGAVSTTVKGLKPKDGRWFRFDVSAMAEDEFHVADDGLFLVVEFYRDNGSNSLDKIKKQIFAQVKRERADLKDEGTNKNLGLGAWRRYSLEFRTPFPEVDTLELSIGFRGKEDSAKGRSGFSLRQIQLTSIADPAGYAPREAAATKDPSELANLVPLGGRWYYDPRGGSREVPKMFDETNSDRLIYRSGRLEAPFAGNMTSWLKAGYLDFDGNEVKEDRYVSNSLLIEVTEEHLVLRSKNLPNHPTAKFPDSWRFLDGNPAYIKEQRATWFLPLEPKVNPEHVAMDRQNANQALPMGAIGVATNGVIFFNPFDHIFEADATWRLDRCCGHPSPNYQYHYHKYPVCVKSPWTDDGENHSPVIGFGFDGFPVYGPYEAKGELAKDSSANPLNDFNVHRDDARGWHYHVTPGRFPHIIGGYWGVLEQMNRRRGRR